MIVKPISWAAAIDAATAELEHTAIADARLNSELLAAHAMGVWKRSDVRARSKDLLGQTDLDFYQSLIRRRLRHEPLQYITGETEFYGLRLYASPAALIPRPDTEILVEETITEAALHPGMRILDIGTGSGSIALAVASKLPNASVIGIDTSSDALALAQKNRERCGFANVSFTKADVTDIRQMQALGRFDFIVSNPPYIPLAEYEMLEPEVRDYEPRSALTDEGDGTSFYHTIFAVAPQIMTRDARLLLEIGHGAAPGVTDMAPKRFRYLRTARDLAGIERVIVFDLVT